MITNPNAETDRLILLVATALLIGLLFDAPAWTLVVALGVWAIVTLKRIQSLARWLADENHRVDNLPESEGLWGDIFNTLHRTFRESQDRSRELGDIIDRAYESVSALRDGVVFVDRHGHLEWWNTAAGQFLHLNPDTDRGQVISNLIRDPIFTAYFRKGDYSNYLEIPAPHNQQIILQFYISRFGEGDYLFLVRDITRLHNLEQMRREFVSNVSHELKTPVTVFRGYVETLEDQRDKLPPAMQKAIQHMSTQAQRMTAIIDDLLLLSRLENSPVERRPIPVDLHELATAVADMASTIGRERNVSITVDIPVGNAVLGNYGELHSALSNLVLNAVKYGHENGHVTITLREDSSALYVDVVDDGPGIDPTLIPRLTERFFRVDNARNSQTGGTGLGLAIVKHVLLRHDARLKIESTPGKGSRFTCMFPLSRKALIAA